MIHAQARLFGYGDAPVENIADPAVRTIVPEHIEDRNTEEFLSGDPKVVALRGPTKASERKIAMSS